MLCILEKCKKDRGHRAHFVHNMDGFYNNFATDEFVIT